MISGPVPWARDRIRDMKDKILQIIGESEWVIIKDQENIKMIQVQNGRKKINIYWGTMTVWDCQTTIGTKDVSFSQLRDILGIKKGLFQVLRAIFE